jgi:hypothetical protein
MPGFREGGVPIRELTADLFISVDGFASGAKKAAFFGYFGEEPGRWVSDIFANLFKALYSSSACRDLAWGLVGFEIVIHR